MDSLKRTVAQLPWMVIIVLGAAALMRPVVGIFGDVIGYELSLAGTISLTFVIAAAWIYTMVGMEIKRPIVVLAASGGVYAVLSVLLAVLLQLLAPGLGSQEAKISVLLTAGLLGSVTVNVIYGAFLGVIAKVIQNFTNSKPKVRK